MDFNVPKTPRGGILFWNCCGGLPSKINEINSIIDIYGPEAFFIAESELTQTNTPWCQVNGYSLLTTTTTPSRIACYLITGSSLTQTDNPTDTQIIVLDDSKRRIVGYYKPFKIPTGKTKKEIDDNYHNALFEFTGTTKDVWLGGRLQCEFKEANPRQDKAERMAG
jgi:hypothetical protein